MSRHRADWSELSQEILASIASRLGTQDDVRHFQAVCKKWLSSTPQIPPNLPILSPLFPHQLSTTPLALSKSTDFRRMFVYDYSLVIVANTTFILLPRRQQQIPRLKPWLITVEELNLGKFIVRKPLTRFAIDTWAEDFPSILYSGYLKVREIHKAYNFRYLGETPYFFHSGNWRWYNNKVIMFFNPASASPTVDDCYALVLHDKGNLLYVRLKDEDDYGYLHCGGVSCFDDIVNYRGSVWAIDRVGWVYVVQYSNELRPSVFCNDGVRLAFPGNSRMRLVESSEGLYLIERYHHDVYTTDNYITFTVYKLDEEERKWNRVNSLNGRILFISTDCCFFASAEDFPGRVGNCIFFPKDHFPNYKDSTYPDEFYFKGASKELEIGVFHLDDGETGLISNYLGYSDIFWPPPKWLALHSSIDSRRNKKKQKDFGCQYSQEEERSPPILELAKEGQIVENSSISAQQVAVESVEASKTTNFQGVDVRSEFVPILEKIWAKYGNVAQGSFLRGSLLVARALESIAEAVVVLTSTPGKSLDQSQADTLRDTLVDLQGLKFRVDWLVPFIDKALACRRSNLERMKANLQETKRKHLEELAALEHELVEIESQLDKESRPVNGLGPNPIDLEKCLGEGLC